MEWLIKAVCVLALLTLCVLLLVIAVGGVYALALWMG